MLIGAEVDGKHYAKLANAPGVFTLSGMAGIINMKPFNLINKFAMLVNIDLVDRLSITGGERDLVAEIHGTGENAVFSLNNRRAEGRSFREFYQAVIGLLIEAELPGQVRQDREGGEIQIEYLLKPSADVPAGTLSGDLVSITLIPFNRDFYALRQEGATEFLISRSQVRKIYEAAAAVAYTQ